MKNWLLGQSDFTRWSAIGASASLAIGMVASAVLVIAIIVAFMLETIAKLKIRPAASADVGFYLLSVVLRTPGASCAYLRRLRRW